MDKVIATNNLTKHYGDIIAVDNLSIALKRGEIYGFLGLNGAGKTTTIRMLLGMIKPTNGEARIFNETVHPYSTNLWSRVGYLVETPHAYPQLSVRENLELFRRLYKVKNPGAVERIIKQLGLSEYANRKAKFLSLGNVQRLGLAKALIHEPEILMLDEPANGLDPAGVVEIRELLRTLARDKGITVFMSSHILGEVSRIATRIGIIHEGRLIEELETIVLNQRLQQRLIVDVLDRRKALVALKEAGFTVRENQDGTFEIMDKHAIDHPDEISRFLVEKDTPPILIKVEKEDLESHFLRLVGKTEIDG